MVTKREEFLRPSSTYNERLLEKRGMDRKYKFTLLAGKDIGLKTQKEKFVEVTERTLHASRPLGKVRSNRWSVARLGAKTVGLRHLLSLHHKCQYRPFSILPLPCTWGIFYRKKTKMTLITTEGRIIIRVSGTDNKSCTWELMFKSSTSTTTLIPTAGFVFSWTKHCKPMVACKDRSHNKSDKVYINL